MFSRKIAIFHAPSRAPAPECQATCTPGWRHRLHPAPLEATLCLGLYRLAPNRSRGILIKGSNGVISGNSCRGNWGSGILISPEWWRLEADSSYDLTFSGNTSTGWTSRG